ncbi:MAG: DUF3024 domain-containing protein [Actinomycetota bacterium]
MSLPELVRRGAEAKVAAFCDQRVPAHAREEVRLEYPIRGGSITIVERRPPWRAEFGPDWTSLKIAQLRYDAAAKAWTLWWADRNERWDRYWDMDPTPDIDELLREIDEDPTGIFWG